MAAQPNQGQLALLSDVHGNRVALEAVLADLTARGISRVTAWAIWSDTVPIRME